METTCGKCSGQGRIRGFGHIENGKCFLCGGSGKVNAGKASFKAHNAAGVADALASHKALYIKRAQRAVAMGLVASVAAFTNECRRYLKADEYNGGAESLMWLDATVAAFPEAQ